MSESPTTGTPVELPDTIGVTRSGKLHLIDRKSVGTAGPLRAACNRTFYVDRVDDLDPRLSSDQQWRTVRHLTHALKIQERRDRLILSSTRVCANCDTAVRRELKS